MAIDVYVTRLKSAGRGHHIDDKIYPKMHHAIIEDGCLWIWRKKYPSLPHDTTMIHEVSMPLSTVWEWRVEEVG